MKIKSILIDMLLAIQEIQRGMQAGESKQLLEDIIKEIKEKLSNLGDL